ncbi:hypothetical protein SO694_00004460 [Aureococcus anophagefferens]|uniref:Uncharacterized protein n=1 Tax=Aureococcus anophagefferens TaxID=44056 RepID=A0ABR1G945_AURAN
MVAAKAGGLRSPPRARSPLRTMSDVEVSSLKRPTSCWFEEEGPSKPDPDDLLAAGAMDLVALIAATRPRGCPCARGSRRVSRSLKDFARLRRELLAVLPELSSVINVSDLSNLGGSLGRGEALLPSLPADAQAAVDAKGRGPRRPHAQRRRHGDLVRVQGARADDLDPRHAQGLRQLPRARGSSSGARAPEAKSRAGARLIGFLLKSAKVAVRRASELAPTPAETRSARAGTV